MLCNSATKELVVGLVNKSGTKITIRQIEKRSVSHRRKNNILIKQRERHGKLEKFFREQRLGGQNSRPLMTL